MHRTCIAIIDASRARLFTLDRTADPGGLHEELVENQDLVNPVRRLTSSEQLSDRTGLGAVNGRGFTYDDHREARTEALDREFAKSIATEVHRLTDDKRVRRLIVCASPNMLGELRQVTSFTREGLAIDEVARDLVKLTPPQLRSRLTEYGLLPA